MSVNANNSPSSLIAQLATARNLALGDATHYPRIAENIIPLIKAGAASELRRWGADFISEAFATPALPAQQKEQLSLKTLELLRGYLETPGEDAGVLKSTVQAATSIYPFVFRHTIYNPDDASTWQHMAAIKSHVLRRMDSWPAGVRVCCIKFIQRVVQVQTPGIITDPSRPDQNELSLALVPHDHPLIPPSKLEAEASGLLDRLLSVVQEAVSDALYVTATINALSVLLRTRASIANRILTALLNFNPFSMAGGPMSPRVKVMVRSMERTIRAFFINLNKRNPAHPLAGRVQGYIDSLTQRRMEVFDESRKRPLPQVEPTDGLDSAKRQRLDAEYASTPPPQPAQFPPLPPGPVSLAQMFTLTRDVAIANFDVTTIPFPLLSRITEPVLNSIDRTRLDAAVNAVRARWLTATQVTDKPTLSTGPGSAGISSARAQGFGGTEQLLNQLDATDAAPELEADVALGPFVVQHPPPMAPPEIDECGRATLDKVLAIVMTFDESATTKGRVKAGFNRLAASSYDRDAWVTLTTRLSTRTTAGLQDDSDTIKREPTDDRGSARAAFSLSENIREALYNYVLLDFRKRIDVAISWLNEEWYNDRIMAQSSIHAVENYPRWALKVLDGFSNFLDAKDKLLIRFMSEIPEVNTELLERVKRLARDPERVTLAVNALHYLILLRPPAREICIDALEDLWKNNDSAKTAAAKLLSKWRPEVLQLQEQSSEMDVKSSPVAGKGAAAV